MWSESLLTSKILKSLTKLLLFIAIFCSVLLPVTQAQNGDGPGGPDDELVQWYRADLLSLVDGAAVANWPDASSQGNDAFVNNTSAQPTFRNVPPFAVNNRPSVVFDGVQNILNINNTPDVNTDNYFDGKFFFFVFKTGSSTSSRQMLYEQGGSGRGLNIYIFDDSLYVGAYNLANDDATTPWGFFYLAPAVEIQPNTTYSVMAELDPIDGEMRSWLDNQLFGSISGLGNLFAHGGRVGLGSVRDNTYIETGPIFSDSRFNGGLLEVGFYNRALDDAERNILANYLGSKYNIQPAVNDFFTYDFVYNYDVGGIGQDTSGNSHTSSISTGLLEVSNPSGLSNSEYLFWGHDNAGANTWTSTEAINADPNLERLPQEWIFQETGDVGTVNFRVDAAQLPALPSGYTKYGIAIDDDGDFSSGATTYELINTSGSNYELIGADIADAQYLTIVAIRPLVQFVLSTSNDFEPVSPAEIDLVLNYLPAAPTNVDYNITAGSATNGGTDYSLAPAGTITFPAGSDTSTLSFSVNNDIAVESSEDVELTLSAATAPGSPFIGPNAVHTYIINDDDNARKIGFAVTASSGSESVSTVDVLVEIPPAFVSPAVTEVDYTVIAGTAQNGGVDFDLPAGTATIAPNTTSTNISLTVNNDLLYETDETLLIELSNPVNGNLQIGGTQHTYTILDDDAIPDVEFFVTASSVAETTPTRQVLVELSAVAGADVTVEYDVVGGTATNGGIDYNLLVPATVTIPAGTVTDSFPVAIVNDVEVEINETVELEIISATNANIGTNSDFELTIEDDDAFGFTGPAGIGDNDAMPLWYSSLGQGLNHNTPVALWIDTSGNDFDLVQNTLSDQPTIRGNPSDNINDRPYLHFDGSDIYPVPNNPAINSSGPYEQKTILVAFRTSSDVTSRQVLFEQGASGRGLNIYIDSGRLRFGAWNLPDDDGGATTPWGYVELSNPIGANRTYFVRLEYDFTGNGLTAFINGNEIGNFPTVGRLFSHAEPGIGGMFNDTRFFFGAVSGTGSYFTGDILDVAYWNGVLNSTQELILANSFAAKTNVSFPNDIYPYDPQFGHEIAGIGQESGSSFHLDAKGASYLRINNATSLGDGEYLLWGHNKGNLEVKNTADIPGGIANRMNRSWRVHEIGEVGNVDIRFYLSNFDIADGNHLALLIDSDDGEFTNASIITSGMTYNPVTKVVTFPSVSLDDGDWLTIASTSNETVLPVELLKFNAVLNGDRVDLGWEVAGEENLSHYVVERQLPNSEVFAPISEKAALYNQQTGSFRYEARDPKPAQGRNLYRLKTVDMDGTASYSSIVEVLYHSPAAMNIYPNPLSSGALKLEWSNLQEEYVQVRILNLQGAEVFREVYPADQQRASLQLELPAGVYLVKLGNSSQQVLRKLVVH